MKHSKGGVLLDTVLTTVSTFVSTVASNGVMFGILITTVAVGIGRLAFGTVKRFLRK